MSEQELDENGNPIVAPQPTAKELELINALAEKNQAVENLTEEIKQVRKEKQEAEKNLQNNGGETPEDVFKRLLEKEKQESVKTDLETAKDEFKKDFKEFSEANDPGGLKYAQFEKELRKFNLDGLKSKDGFKNRFREVYEFMKRSEKKADEGQVPYNGSSSHQAGDPEEVDTTNLSAAEIRLINERGMTKEEYIKAKAKKPAFFATLLRYQ
jgi:phage I-like protein